MEGGELSLTQNPGSGTAKRVRDMETRDVSAHPIRDTVLYPSNCNVSSGNITLSTKANPRERPP